MNQSNESICQANNSQCNNSNSKFTHNNQETEPSCPSSGRWIQTFTNGPDSQDTRFDNIEIKERFHKFLEFYLANSTFKDQE